MTVALAPTPPGRLRAFAADIKLSHSVFALPFALLSATLAARTPGARWGVWSFALVVACMVCARTVAMAANRVLDAELDRLNPRTARRAIPAGQLSKPYVLGLIGLFAGGFVASAGGFWVVYGNPWPLWLSVPVLAFLNSAIRVLLADDPAAPAYDARLVADLAAVDPAALDRLAGLDAGEAAALAVTGWGPWQVLLGALDGARVVADVRGVLLLGAQHVVGTWVAA